MTKAKIPPNIVSALTYDIMEPTNYRNQCKLLATIDWFQITITQTIYRDMFDEDELLVFGCFRLELLPFGRDPWQSGCNVFYGSEKVGVLDFDGRNINGIEGKMVYKLENWVLYDETFRGWIMPELVERFLREIKSQFISITRLDIAVDGVDLDLWLKAYLSGPEWGIDRFKRLKVPKNIEDVRYDRNTGMFTQFKAGTPQVKRVQYYNKSKEIREKGDQKKYILDYFNQNGFDTSQDIKRFELQLWGKTLNKYEIELSDLFDHEKLVSLFEQHLKNLFEFVPAVHSDSRVSRRPRIPFFEWGKFERSTYTKVERVPDGRTGKKRRIKDLLREAYTDREENAFPQLQVIYNTIDRYRLWPWFRKKWFIYQNEFDKQCRIDGTKPNDLFEGRFIPEVLSMVGECDL